MGLTERPDVLAGKLLEGRVGILIDGSPFALTAPYFFIEAFQNPEDYYARSTYASIVRIFRYLAFLLSILVPGLYVALTSYHQELIPGLPSVQHVSLKRRGTDSTLLRKLRFSAYL